MGGLHCCNYRPLGRIDRFSRAGRHHCQQQPGGHGQIIRAYYHTTRRRDPHENEHGDDMLVPGGSPIPLCSSTRRSIGPAERFIRRRDLHHTEDRIACLPSTSRFVVPGSLDTVIIQKEQDKSQKLETNRSALQIHSQCQWTTSRGNKG